MKTITYDPDTHFLVPTPITEQMHAAAVKVLYRATGVDGLPQRMLNAMLAAAPAPVVGQQDGEECEYCGRPESVIEQENARLNGELSAAEGLIKTLTQKPTTSLLAQKDGRIVELEAALAHESSAALAHERRHQELLHEKLEGSVAATPPLAQQGDLPALPTWLTDSAHEAYKMPRARLMIEFQEYARAAIAASAGKSEVLREQASTMLIQRKKIQALEKELTAAKASPQPQQVGLDFSKPLETVKTGESVAYVCGDVIEFKCARVCVDQSTGIVYSSPYHGLQIRNVAATPSPAVDAASVRDADRLRELEELGIVSAKTTPAVVKECLTTQPAPDMAGALAEWEKLKDPVVLHVNLLRGFPARLTPIMLRHIAGDYANSTPDLAARDAAPNWKEQSYTYRDRLLVALEELATLKSNLAAQGDKQ